MDVFELVRRFRELEDKVAELQKHVANLERNKTDKITYPYIPPSYTYPLPATYPHSFPTLFAQLEKKFESS